MDSSEDLQQIQIIFDPCIRSSGNDTTPILVLFACGCANSCQQMLSKTSISLNRAGCSDPLSSYVSRAIKGWICHLRYDPVLMTLITVCCLCTALHYQADGSAWVSASYRAFPQTSITQCKWDWNQRMAYCGYHQKGPKSSGNIWRVGLSNSHKFKKLVFASRWAIKELPAFYQKFLEANALRENVSIGKVIHFQIKFVPSNNLWLLPAATQLLCQCTRQAPASLSPSPSHASAVQRV